MFFHVFHRSSLLDSFLPRSRRMSSSLDSRGVLFVNFDSSYNKDKTGGKAGDAYLGIIFRANEGSVLKFAAAELGKVTSPSVAELKGLEVTLLIMRKEGLDNSHTCIRTDCQEVRDLVRDYIENCPTGKGKMTRLQDPNKKVLMNSIQTLYNKAKYKIELVLRKFNFVADFLSNILIPKPPQPLPIENFLLNLHRRSVNPNFLAERIQKGINLGLRLGLGLGRNVLFVDCTNMESRFDWSVILVWAHVEFQKINHKFRATEPIHPFAPKVFGGWPDHVPHTVLVGKLDKSCTCEEVFEHFSKFGAVKNVAIIKDNFGESKGFSYVEFFKVGAVKNAVLLNTLELHGRPLKVKEKRVYFPNSVPRGVRNQGIGIDMGLYSWYQTLDGVSITLPVYSWTKSENISCEIAENYIKVILKYEKHVHHVLHGVLSHKIKVEDCSWGLEDGKKIFILLKKQDVMRWWYTILNDEPELESCQLVDDLFPVYPVKLQFKGRCPNPIFGAHGAPNQGNWIQTFHDVTITINVPSWTKSGDIACEISEKHVKVGLKGEKPVLHGELCHNIKVHDCFWSLSLEDKKYISIRLIKQDLGWWDEIVNGEPEIHTQKVELERSNGDWWNGINGEPTDTEKFEL